MRDSNNCICIEFPLRGKWRAPTSPVDRIPSHGTNRMGLRYAFDFFQTDNHCEAKFFKNSSTIRYLLLGIPLED